jgi:hypothetical protein
MWKPIAPLLASLFVLTFAIGCEGSRNDMPEFRLTEPQDER